MEENSKPSKRKWTPTEDEELVACMVELRKDGRFNADTGFKAGYLIELEKMLSKKLGTGMRATNISSRIKTLRKEWAIVHDMIHGSTSGFGWDNMKNMPVAENDVWETYIKSHKNAAPFRRKCFPHYEDLTFIYAKDRANGKDAQGIEDILEEIENDENDNNNEMGEHDNNHEEDNPIALEDLSPNLPASLPPTKRKKKTHSEDTSFHNMVDVIKDLGKDFREVGQMLSTSFTSELNESQKQDYRKLLAALRDVEGLTSRERNIALNTLTRNPQQLFLFFELAPSERLEWVRTCNEDL